MKKMDYQPIIFGTLCEHKCKADSWTARKIADIVGESVMLPFAVEKRHIKNVILTMKLMDIMGLAVEGGHRKAITKHLPSLDASARSTGSADVIVRRGRSFKGYDSIAMALKEWCREINVRGKRAAIIGQNPLAKTVTTALKGQGFKVSSLRNAKELPNVNVMILGNMSTTALKSISSQLHKLPAKPAIIDLSGKLGSLKGISRLGPGNLDRRARSWRVELLTSAVKDNHL